MTRPVFDERDRELVAEFTAALERAEGPRCGDFVEFADGVVRRISYVWPDGVQTSDSGSWALGRGYVSFSGSLYGIVKMTALTLTARRRMGAVWIFHHDLWQAHYSVDAEVEFRVYESTEPAPR